MAERAKLKPDRPDPRKILLSPFVLDQFDEALDKGRKWNKPYIETSAKTRENVDKVRMALLLLKKLANTRKLSV